MQTLQSPKNIILPIAASGNSHSTCVVCKRRGPKLVTVSLESRYRLFVEKGHLIISGTRCCPNHLNSDGYFSTEAKGIIKDDDNAKSSFNRTEIFSLIDNVRAIAIRNEQKRIDFDDPNSLTDGDYVSLTGLSKNDFEDLSQYISTVKSSKNRTSRTCLSVLLVKLRTGLSNRLMSTMFNIGKSAIRRAIHSAREALCVNFVPKFLGFQHISREKVISKHTRPLAQELFGNFSNPPAILVIDGTYIYIQKSGNFQFQRRSYNTYKTRPLVKPMVYVTTTGYIVSVMGPYLSDSKNNDAGIIKHAEQGNMENMMNWLTEEDIIVVDRGFRYAVEMLQDLGIKSEMPVFLPKGQKQYTTVDANTSRLVTKVRWVVESVNGRIKQWKYLSNIVPNTQIPYIGDFVRIVAALCNKYRPPLSSADHDADQILAAKMRVLAKDKNSLQERVREESLDRRTASWKRLEADNAVVDFPSLSEDDLRNITLGVYQLKMARSYTHEHLENGDYTLMVDESISGIIRVSIQSRHISAKKYLLWVEYDQILVKSWYCQCRAGSRVVGACAHVSSVLWYLGYARHLDKISWVRNWTKFLADAAVPVLMDDSDGESEPEE
ncbi:uncharacterized protein LOC117338945 [Pecten maximus]|uniref:uncharacterized protein LOC117338945 n=1 Tax=Pecten maximus TaxID=6579 RepID=UPI0014585AE1|nr:uncharacterized protein LOC117338945 [Pecten maximus]